MRRPSRTSLCLCLLLVVAGGAGARAAGERDALHPCPSPYAGYRLGAFKDLERTLSFLAPPASAATFVVRRILRHNRGGTTVLSVVSEGGEYQVRYTRFRGGFSPTGVPDVISDARAPISRETALAVSASWNAVLLEARFPKEPYMVLDADVSIFTRGGSCGEVENPPLSSPPGRLEELAKLLQALTDSATQEERVSQERAILLACAVITRSPQTRP